MCHRNANGPVASASEVSIATKAHFLIETATTPRPDRRCCWLRLADSTYETGLGTISIQCWEKLVERLVLQDFQESYGSVAYLLVGWIFQDESVAFSILFHAGDAHALRKQRRLIKLQEILRGMKFAGRVTGIVSGRTIPEAFCFWPSGLNRCEMFGNERIGNTNGRGVVCVFLEIIL